MNILKKRKIKFNSIGNQVIIAIIICTLITSILVGVISLSTSKNVIDEETTSKLSYMSQSYANKFDQNFNKVEFSSNSLKHLITSKINVKLIEGNSDYLSNFLDDIKPTIEKIAQEATLSKSAYVHFNPELTGDTHSVWYFDNDADGIVTSQKTSPVEAYKTRPEDGSMEWWFAPIEQKKGVWTDPYEWKLADGSIKIFVSYTEPVFIDNKLIAVVGTDFMFDNMAQIISSIKVYDSGYAFLLNNNHQFISHPEYKKKEKLEEIENGELAWLTKELKEKDILTSKIEIDGKENMASYVKLSNGWNLAITAPINEIYAKHNKMKNNIYMTILVGVFICIIVAYIIGKGISNPIEKLNKYLEVLSTGNFSNSIDSKLLKSHTEIGDIAKSIAKMQTSVGNMIKGIISEAKTVEISSTDASNHMSDLSLQIEDISATTEEMSAGMEQTAASTQEMNASSVEIESAVESIAKKAQEGAANANEIRIRADKLKQDVITKQDIANQIREEINDKLKKAIENSKAVEQINVLSDAIMQITSQTNLLALNAAIEAARAGEVGKGFAVVADEIRKLAENSKNTVVEIQKVTEQVLLSVQDLVEGSEQVLFFIDTNVIKDYEGMVKTGDQYYNDSEFLSDITTGLSATSQQLMASIQNMVNAINEISTANNESAQGAQNIAQRSEVVVVHVNDVANLSNDTKLSSEKLKNMVEQFKI